jgi:hypothetical protein
MSDDEERELWRNGELCCVMQSCCSGAELQIRRDDEVILRELYPTKSDLYERAQELKAQVSRLKFDLKGGQTGRRR